VVGYSRVCVEVGIVRDRRGYVERVVMIELTADQGLEPVSRIR